MTEVLARTGGFSTKVARHRLYETTQHILQVTQSLDSVKPGGVGHVSSIRVRLLHAAVRRRILKLAAEKPSYYSVEEFGIPINDLDCIATIGTFSATLIWLGFPRQGIWIREQEVEDYLALWRLVAYYMGTPTEPFETPTKAKRMMESILVSEIMPTETSKVLANNIILSLQGQAPTYASRDFLNANARWLNGNDLADALGLGRPSFYYWALVAGQCIFFCVLCYTYRSIPYLDRRKIRVSLSPITSLLTHNVLPWTFIWWNPGLHLTNVSQALRKIFYQIIVENKTHGLGEETVFDFKYIPNFSLTTELGQYEESNVKQTGIEKRNLRTLVVASTALAVFSYLGMRTTWGIVAGLRDWWGV